MAEPRSFAPVKLICGIIAGNEEILKRATEKLIQMYGGIDLESAQFPFDFTDYYEKQMGRGLKRIFISFERLISPEGLSGIKMESNRLEVEIKEEIEAGHRIVNIDPGYLTSSALVMATAKDFAHRIPLKDGIYAHLEFLFGKDEVRILDWTYPDFRSGGYQDFFTKVRRLYLAQLKKINLE